MQQQMEQMHQMCNAWRDEQQAQQQQDVKEEERLYQEREEMHRDARLEQIYKQHIQTGYCNLSSAERQ